MTPVVSLTAINERICLEGTSLVIAGFVGGYLRQPGEESGQEKRRARGTGRRETGDSGFTHPLTIIMMLVLRISNSMCKGT